MFLVREIMYCKPGKVRPMIEMSVKMAGIMEKHGMGKMRVLSDLASERYWTVISEYEVQSLEEFEKSMRGEGMSAEATKEMESVGGDYHQFVDYGRREIYKIEK